MATVYHPSHKSLIPPLLSFSSHRSAPPSSSPSVSSLLAVCGWSHRRFRMKSPAHRTRDIERQAGYLKREHCTPPPPRTGSDTMWFIRDSCGIVCGIITWLLVFYAEFVVVFVMLLPAKNVAYSLFNGVLFNGLAFLALASHAKAMCTDPVSQSFIGPLYLLVGCDTDCLTGTIYPLSIYYYNNLRMCSCWCAYSKYLTCNSCMGY